MTFNKNVNTLLTELLNLVIWNYIDILFKAMNRKKLRDLLVSLKGDRHWSVVGREMGVNPQNLRGWVRGDSVPTSDNLIAIANYMQVPVGSLILQLSDDSDVPMDFERTITDAQQALASLISLSKEEKAKLAYLLLGEAIAA